MTAAAAGSFMIAEPAVFGSEDSASRAWVQCSALVEEEGGRGGDVEEWFTSGWGGVVARGARAGLSGEGGIAGGVTVAAVCSVGKAPELCACRRCLRLAGLLRPLSDCGRGNKLGGGGAKDAAGAYQQVCCCCCCRFSCPSETSFGGQAVAAHLLQLMKRCRGNSKKICDKRR